MKGVLKQNRIYFFSFLLIACVFFAACIPGWTSYDSHCYRFISTRNSWIDAENHCLNLNSDLMSITSDVENKLAESLAGKSSGCVWIGLRFHKDVAQMNKQLQWSDGTFLNLTKWNVNPPTLLPVIASLRKRRSVIDENNYVCVFYDVHSTFWVNESCSKDCSFVCKKKGRSKYHTKFLQYTSQSVSQSVKGSHKNLFFKSAL